MKKINKFLSILLATVLILSLFPVSLAHASDNTVTFSAQTDVVSAKAGDIVNVDICMSENSVVAALTLIVNYDNTALKILNVQSKEAFGYEEFNTAYGNNKLAYLTASANPKTVGGTLFTIQFEVLKDGCTEISLSVKELADIDLQSIPSATQSAKIHNYETEITPPTCTEDGFTTYTCACGDTYVGDYVDETGHSFSDWTTEIEPNCTETGLEKQTCSACGETETNELPAKGHSYNSVVTAPTCTETGFTTHTCACGDSYVDGETPAKGHSYNEEITKPATHTENGVMTYTCACGDSYTETINATGDHYYAPEITSPTCTEAGYTTYTCVCGDTYVGDETQAKGHSFSNGNCTVCGEADPDYYVFSVKEPSKTTIRNKDGIILHAEIEGNAPAGSYVEWTASNSNFDKTVMNDGKSMRVIANNKGNTTFTATLYDVNGNVLATDTVELYSQSGFFDKIVGFFRSLFGMTMVYEK